MAKRTGDIELAGVLTTPDGATAGDAGEELSLTAGSGNATSGDGGSVSITAGGGVDAGDGGNITLSAGAGAGAGSAGAVVIPDSLAPSSVANKLYSVGGVLTWNGTTIDTGGTGISAVVEDTTPQLGGDLDGQGFTITDAKYPLGINAQVGVTYTAVLADASKVITLTNAAAIAMTIPANASVAYPVGTQLNFEQLGAGAVTIGITSDTLSINAGATAVTNGQYSIVTALKIATTEWILFGQLVPALPPLTSVAISDLDDGTDGELITWDASGVATTVAVGTANQVLTSNGAGAEPTFQAIPGGTSVNILDADGDTSITTENSADEDLIRFDTGDTPIGFPAASDVMVLGSSGLTVLLPTANVATTAGAPINLTSGIGNTTGGGGAINITTGDGGGTGPSGNGGTLTLQGGEGYGGGAVQVLAGDSNVQSGNGGTAALRGGDGEPTGSGDGGGVSITGGDGGYANASLGGDGGNVSIIGGGPGYGSGYGLGGSVGITGGESYGGYSANQAGNIIITGGIANNTNYGYGGNVTLTGGVGDYYAGSVYIDGGNSSYKYGGAVSLSGGTASNGYDAGTVYLTGGAGGGGVAGDVWLRGGAGTANGYGGGEISLRAGTGNGGGFGGYIEIAGGVGGATGDGGDAELRGGSAGVTSGDGGNVIIRGANPNNTTGAGGDVSITGGLPSTSGTSGIVTITGGSPSVASAVAGGAVNIAGGAGGSTSGVGGALTLSGGAASGGSSTGGAVNINAGSPSTSGDGGSINLNVKAGTGAGADGSISFQRDGTEFLNFAAGSGLITTPDGASAGLAGEDITLTAGSGHATSGDGGGVNIIGGSGVDAGDGGDITLTAGAGAGAGSAGAIVIPNSSAPSSVANKLYSIGGVLTWNGTTLDTGGGGISSVLEDTTPQLGGDLDVNNFDIVGSPAAGATSSGNPVVITASDAGATSGDGGAVSITAGAGAGAVSGHAGGDITITPGAGAGAGSAGAVVITATTAPTVTTNKLYNVAGALTWNGTDLTAGGGAGDEIVDADGDTRIQVEETADEDTIRMDTGDNVAGFPAQANAMVLSSGQFTVALPTSNTSYTAGGAINITGGGGNYANGGAANLVGGVGGTSNDGGAVNITGGAATASNGYQGGKVIITGGQGHEEHGGNVEIYGGSTTNGAVGGTIALTSGSPSTGAAGAIFLTVSPSIGTNQPGQPISLLAGQGGLRDSGGDVTIYGGASNSTSGNGGSILLQAAYGVNGTSARGIGGDITLTPGAGAGSGSAGAIVITATAAPTVTTNKLYNVAGALTWNGTDLTAGGGGISNVVEDTTPQLGGDLDVNGNDIVGAPAASVTSAGGVIGLVAANGGSTSGDGGAVTITGGDVSSVSGNVGGDVNLTAGSGSTADDDGEVVISTGAAGELERIMGYIATNSTGASALIATIPITSGDSAVYEVFAVARQDSGTESAAFRIFGGVENTGGTAALIGSSAKDRTDDGGTSVDWDVVIGVSSGNLTITLDNDAETVDWKFNVRLTEL